MSYARSLGREEEKRYSKALENGSAVTYVDENGEAHKGVTAPADDLPADYRGIYEEQMAVNNAAAAAAAAYKGCLLFLLLPELRFFFR